MIIAVFPPIESEAEAELIRPLFAWYFPAFLSKCDVYVWRSDDYIPSCNWEKEIYHSIAQKPITQTLKSADLIIYWMGADFASAPSCFRRKGLCVDLYTAASWEDHLCAQLAKINPEAIAQFADVFSDWQHTNFDKNEALILGPGPSLNADIEALADKEHWNLYIGSTIFDENLKYLCPPHFIIAADGASQFSHSSVANKFKLSACDTMRETGAFLVLPSDYIRIIKSHWPADVHSQCLAVPEGIDLPTIYRLGQPWAYQPTANVLTSLALPCAYAVASTINFGGISLQPPRPNEGGKPSWGYANRLKGLQLRAEVMQSFPMSGWTKGDYLEQHYSHLQSWVSVLLAANVQVKLGGKAIEGFQSGDYKQVGVLNLIKGAYLFLTWCELNPRIPLFLLFILGVFMSTLVNYFFNLEMLCIFLGSSIFSGGFLIYLYVKKRMNVKLIELERRLNLTQSRHFENLCSRMEILEQGNEKI